MNETRCDRCGAVIRPQKKALLTTREIRTQAFLLPPCALENINYDLCPRCHGDFKDFMAGRRVNEIESWENDPIAY